MTGFTIGLQADSDAGPLSLGVLAEIILVYQDSEGKGTIDRTLARRSCMLIRQL